MRVSGLALISLLLCLPGCRSNAPLVTQGKASPPVAGTAATSGFPCTVIDARGKTLTFASAPRRIVSLAPSETEDLYDLGVADRIVADTTADDFPAAARQLPHVTGNMMDPSVESIESFNPDLVVAVGSINQKTVAALDRANVPTLVVDPKTVEDTYAALKLLGRATGTEARAATLTSAMQARIGAVRQRMARAAARPKVLILYDVNPIYTTGPGSFIDDLIQVAGGQNIVSSPVPGNVLSPERVIAAQPEVILCEPYLRDKVQQFPGWREGIAAVRKGAFFSASEGATLVRPTPRLANGAEELARFLHPELK